MNVLVTGGAGYIGSHAVQRLHRGGHRVVVLDNLYRGHRAAVPPDVPFYEVDIRDYERVRRILIDESIACVMHFAALAYVGESVFEPLDYYENNTYGSLMLLKAVEETGVRRFVFSSTCATYGEPVGLPVHEDMPQAPINPYGHSKLMVERLLLDYAHTTPDFAFAALRYFNVAGCSFDGTLGEDHEPETHLIPLVIQAALGRREALTIYGDDYDTPDGTCVRDYIHVVDLADAHAVVMEALRPGDRRFYNLGIGKGVSVRDILGAAERVMGRPVPHRIGARRAGDPPSLYADPSRIRDELGWEARITDIGDMIASAWQWFKDHPEGYGDAHPARVSKAES